MLLLVISNEFQVSSFKFQVSSSRFLQIPMWILILLKYTFQLHITQLAQLADHQRVRLV